MKIRLVSPHLRAGENYRCADLKLYGQRDRKSVVCNIVVMRPVRPDPAAARDDAGPGDTPLTRPSHTAPGCSSRLTWDCHSGSKLSKPRHRPVRSRERMEGKGWGNTSHFVCIIGRGGEDGGRGVGIAVESHFRADLPACWECCSKSLSNCGVSGYFGLLSISTVIS